MRIVPQDNLSSEHCQCGGRVNLAEYVTQIRSILPTNSGSDAAIPGGFYEFLQMYASLKDGSPLPEGMARGERGHCYANATHLAADIDGLLYCEGIATSARVGIPMEHAWCLHVDSGRVIDPTWDEPEGGKYYGVAFERTFVVRFTMRTGVYGLLGWESDPSCALYERGVQVDDAGTVIAYADEKARV